MTTLPVPVPNTLQLSHSHPHRVPENLPLPNALPMLNSNLPHPTIKIEPNLNSLTFRVTNKMISDTILSPHQSTPQFSRSTTLNGLHSHSSSPTVKIEAPTTNLNAFSRFQTPVHSAVSAGTLATQSPALSPHGATHKPLASISQEITAHSPHLLNHQLNGTSILSSPSSSSVPSSLRKVDTNSLSSSDSSMTNSLNTAATFLTSLNTYPKLSPLRGSSSKYKVKPLEVAPRAKQSCHQCKLSKPAIELVKCKNIVRYSSHGNKDAIWCKKKYCWKCLRKNYVGIHQDLDKWVCPACCNVCRCARCARDREKAAREAMEAVEATEVNEEEDIKESPTKKRKLEKPLNAILIGPVPALEPLFVPKGQKKNRATVIPPRSKSASSSSKEGLALPTGCHNSLSKSYQLSESDVSKIKPPSGKSGKISDQENETAYALQYQLSNGTRNGGSSAQRADGGNRQLRPRQKKAALSNTFPTRRNLNVHDIVVSPKAMEGYHSSSSSTDEVFNVEPTDVPQKEQPCCITCLKKPPGVVFIPCGHYLLCTPCLKTREKYMKCCTQCGTDIKQCVKLQQKLSCLSQSIPVQPVGSTHSNGEADCFVSKCNDVRSAVVMLPCEHVMELYCKSCSQKPEKCLKCFEAIEQRIPVISRVGQD